MVKSRRCILGVEPFDAVVAVRDTAGESGLWGFPRSEDAQYFATEARRLGLEAIVGFPVMRAEG